MEAKWHEIPCGEGWWWDDESRQWVEVESSELSTALVDPDWRGLWYGPIHIPERPRTINNERTA